MINDDEFVDVDIDCRGEQMPQKTDKIALIDADTVVFAACSVLEQVDELLPEDMYLKEEWEEIINNPGYSKERHTLSFMDIDEAIVHSLEKVQYIMDHTGCSDFEMHFTIGRKSFPYEVSKDYKANRLKSDNKPPPYNLRAVKDELCEKFPDKVFAHTEWEADHIVVCKKRDNFDKYVLCAVDKDVLKALEGKMFNYYQSTRYNIDMKWIENTEEEAMKVYYLQTLTGDTGDGVIGLKGIGPAKAKKALAKCTTEEECWDAVVKMYESNDRDIVDAIMNYRLVDMKQLKLNEDGEYEVCLWKP